MNTFPWILATVAAACALIAVLAAAGLARRRRQPQPLPVDWALTARPVFSASERRIYRLLCDALPHHVVLAKLPLVRFCQPVDPIDVRYWFDLLGSTHVTFAVCSANGRVLAAVDLDRDRANSRRILQIKQSVLGACRIRYLRWAVDSPPSVSELQMLIPSAQAKSAMSAPSAGLVEARDSLASTVASQRARRSARWQESGGAYQDSFFAFDSRLDGFGASELGAAAPTARPEPADRGGVGGVVVDDAPKAARR